MDSTIIQLPKISDSRGNLSIIEQIKHIPFEIKRVHWVYDVPGDYEGGGHACSETEEFIVALSGSFDVVVDNGVERKVFQLKRSYFGLYVPKGIWRKMTNFSTNSFVLVLSSTDYDGKDYITDYEEYVRWKKNGSKVLNPIVNIRSVQFNNMLPQKHVAEGISVYDCSLCKLNTMHYAEGNLTYMYENVHVPFPINRVFYSYDIPGGEERGAHAHKDCHQFLLAASGSFEVVLNDGINKRTVLLNRPFCGLHVPPGIWASEQGFSSSSICLVLASHTYDENDYIRNYDDYLKYLKENRNQ